MAEYALKKLEEQLKCGICLDSYTDPKQLKCNHIYCRKCLVKLVFRDEEGKLILNCPTCRQITPVPARGVTGLQPAFHINNLREIQDSVKNATASESRVCATHESEVKLCSVHSNEELKVFCASCEELICYQCAIKGGMHHSHDHQLVDTAFENYEKEITPLLEPLQNQLTSINESLANLDLRCEEIASKQAAIEASIDDSIRQLHQTLDTRKAELVGELQEISRVKLQSLAVQRNQLETKQVELQSYLEFVREGFEAGNHGDVLMAKTDTLEQVKKLTDKFQLHILKPGSEADMIFSALADITAVCQNYGRITVPVKLAVDPSKCSVSGKYLEVAAVRKKATAVLHAACFTGEPCEELVGMIECELVSEITGSITKGSVERSGLSQYNISYQPTIKGEHQLHIKISGQHIRGSPFSIQVKSPIELLGKSVYTIGGMEQPWGVALNQQGCLIVTEHGRHCVSVFSPSGEKLQSFGKRGSGQGEFDFPCGVAVDDNGSILVIDNSNHRIQKFTAEGCLVTSVGTKGNGPLKFFCPRGIAINATNKKMYIAADHCIQVLNSDLTFCYAFGQDGVRAGEFRYPHGIACDSTGNVYVADSINHRIQVFTAEGQFLRMFGKQGTGNGEMDCPSGIAIDASDRVYVSERYNDRISVFDLEGQFVTSFGGEAGDLHHPSGLAVGNCGLVYVCTSCIQIY